MHFLKQLYIRVEHQLQMVHWLLIRWMCSVHFPHSPFKCLFWQVYVLCTKACANGGLLYGSNKCTNTAKATLRQASKIIKKILVLLTEADQGTHFLNRCKWRRNFTIQNNLILRDWIDCLYRILDWYIFCTWIFFNGFKIEVMANFDNVFLIQLRNLQTEFDVHITLAEKLNMSRQWCDYQGTHYPSQQLHFL